MARRFTGKHMLLIMLAFFGVVIGVNAIMARFAISTFGGTVVDNSYVASQSFNDWLAEARDQKALGWQSVVTLDEGRRIAIMVKDPGGLPLAALRINAIAEHPLGRVKPVDFVFAPVAPGEYRSTMPLPDGRWTVRIEARRAQDRIRLLESLG